MKSMFLFIEWMYLNVEVTLEPWKGYYQCIFQMLYLHRNQERWSHRFYIEMFVDVHHVREKI